MISTWIKWLKARLVEAGWETLIIGCFFVVVIAASSSVIVRTFIVVQAAEKHNGHIHAVDLSAKSHDRISQ